MCECSTGSYCECALQMCVSVSGYACTRVVVGSVGACVCAHVRMCLRGRGCVQVWVCESTARAHVGVREGGHM